MSILFPIILWESCFFPCLADETTSFSTESPRHPRVALALGGGGARGAAHIGVLNVLVQEGIPIDCIAGTSIGAIVGGLYSAGVPLSEISDMIYNKKLIHAYHTVPIPLRLGLAPILLIPRALGHHSYEGLYRGNRLAKFIERSVPPQSHNIEDARVRFGAVTTDLLSGKAYVIKEGSLGKALQASSAIPGLRKPVPLFGRLLCDGAPMANLPVQQAREMGAGIVIAVDVDGPIKPVAAECFQHLGFIENRTTNLFLSKVDEPALKEADLVITPDVSSINLLSTRTSDANQAIKAGEEAARAQLPRLRQLLNLEKTSTIARPSSTGNHTAP